MKDADLIRVMREFGTPTYVFDTEALKERVRTVRSLWGDKVSLCYSVKANPFLIPAMLEVTDHLEVCSPGELEICERLNVPMNGIVYSGVNKEPSDIHQAVSDGVGICTAESIRHVRLLNAEGMTAGKVIPVLLRLSAGSQFGMSLDDLLYVIRNRRNWPWISIEGIHYFVGTQRKNRGLHQQKEELEMLHGLFLRVQEDDGFRLKRLEYGPGLPVPLFEGDDFSDTLGPAGEMAGTLKDVTAWADLTVEAGRFFTTECGYYLTKVVDLKTDRKEKEKGEGAGKAEQGVNRSVCAGEKQYCIVDGGINHVNYLGQIMGMKQPVIRHFCGNGDPDADPEKVHYVPAGNSETECFEYAICGSLCTTNDDLARSREMEKIRLGDILVFGNIGAYSVTEGIYLFLSRKMPRIVLYNGDSDITLARDFTPTSPLNTLQEQAAEKRSNRQRKTKQSERNRKT